MSSNIYGNQGKRTLPHYMQNITAPVFDSLCSTFQLQAARTWSLVKNNHNTSVHLREDGITALNLQELYQFNSNRFLVFDFTTKKENAITGADWEWWFIQQNSFFGTVVQAKVLLRNLIYSINQSDTNGYPQIQRLLNYAIHYQVTPLYCFYNYWIPGTQSPNWFCHSFGNRSELWGCTLADALNTLLLHQRKRHSVKDLLPISVPWHCVACCPGIYSDELQGIATRACGFAQALRQRLFEVPEERDFRENISDLPKINTKRQLPPRIRSLISALQSGHGITRELINDLWSETPPDYVVLQGDITTVLEQ
ncbi:hypothetical protein GTQ43_35840 [Nostoc sp. KVJ3]|uniref:DUF6615 family protein n=1 Tax=Nostoc sp. KVJ3 TaxID=457945 RepID=UPI0022386317|nr:DUF6615 family protein [Nostoc sp. KVJ3]MCW5318833.1 hypothetical protein [Nostoc sp. KVJ3]